MTRSATSRPMVMRRTRLSRTQLSKYAELRRLMSQWRTDDSGEQERSWAIARKAIEKNRGSYRKRFAD